MEYNALYKRYQDAVRLRELVRDKNFVLLREIFNGKMLTAINMNANSALIPYLAGMKEVFLFVDGEVDRIDDYKDELEKVFNEKNQ